MKDDKNLHAGHRNRLKNRFLDSGLDSFETHNILELLLFYSIPQKDTNDIAHELLNHFGSLKNVFDADFEELIKVNGIKENSATLIKLIPALSRAYIKSKTEDVEIFDSADKIEEFLLSVYFGVTNEVVYAMLLNNKFELISLEKLHEGSVNSSLIEPRKLVEAVVKKNASMVILAHNHPNGFPSPSVDDIETTGTLLTTCDAIGVQLLEHFVVSETGCMPIMYHTGSFGSTNKANKLLFRKKYNR